MPFGEAVPPMLTCHPPKSGERQRGCQIVEVNVLVPIAFACERKDRVGAGIDPVGDSTRKVDAEKREAWVRYRVDEGSDKMGTVGNKIVVFPTERHYHDAGIVTSHAADAIAVKSGTIDERFRGEGAARSFHDNLFP